MRYLLDVNTLLALGHTRHAHHVHAQRWLGGLDTDSAIGTCAITELGFVRVSVQAGLQPEVFTARVKLTADCPPHPTVLMPPDLGLLPP